MPTRLDSHWRESRADGVLARSSSRAIGYDELRSLRAPEREHLTGPSESTDTIRGDLGSDLAGISAYYAARIAAAKRSANPAAVRAALMALHNERSLAMRNAIQCWVAASKRRTKRQAAIAPARGAEASIPANSCTPAQGGRGDRPSPRRQTNARKISPDDNNSRKAAVLSSLPIIGLCEWFAGHLEWILLAGTNWWDQVR